MKNNRIKIQLPTIATRDEAEGVMNELALAANNKRKLTARMDAAILKIQEANAPDIAACDEVIKAKSEALRTWAEANTEAFGKKKSIAFLAGTLGFRTGTPKLALLSRAWNWDKVLAEVQQFLPAFVRSRPEVDKEAILNQRDEEAIRAILPRVGMKVVQDEAFYVEPNLTETEVQS